MDLKQMILAIDQTFHVQICVHDVTGVTLAYHETMLDYEQLSHSSLYCQQVKQLMGKGTCMQHKRGVMRLLRAWQQDAAGCMYGVCQMGVCEYVLPVLKNDRLLAVIFAGGAVAEQYDAARERVYRRLLRDAPQRMDFLDTFDRFWREHQTTRDALVFFAQIVADVILERSDSLFLRSSGGVPSNSWQQITPSRTLYRSWIMQTLLPYIHDNYRGSLSLKLISDLYYINPQYLCRIFSRQMGMGVMAYVNHFRILRAAEALENTTLPIAQIGADVGIGDANYFYRLFKKKMGMTPKEYRRQHHGP